MDIQDLQLLCKKMISIRKIIEEYAEETKKLNAELTRMKAEAVEHLEQHGLRNFNFGDGKISITDRRSVKMIDKFKFFDWLKEHDRFEEVASINAKTLTSIYNKEFEIAKEKGDVDFLSKGLPGVSEPNVFRDIRFLK